MDFDGFQMYLLSRIVLGFVIYFKRFPNNILPTKEFHKEKLAGFSKADVFSNRKRKNENKHTYIQPFCHVNLELLRLQNYLFICLFFICLHI